MSRNTCGFDDCPNVYFDDETALWGEDGYRYCSRKCLKAEQKKTARIECSTCGKSVLESEAVSDSSIYATSLGWWDRKYCNRSCIISALVELKDSSPRKLQDARMERKIMKRASKQASKGDSKSETKGDGKRETRHEKCLRKGVVRVAKKQAVVARETAKAQSEREELLALLAKKNAEFQQLQTTLAGLSQKAQGS